mgnify:CR=1 FL=1
MLRKVAVCLALAGTPQLALAQSVQDQIVSQLRGQGFTEISLQRTWLGRVRVIALRDDLRRELVFNPQTGEILRGRVPAGSVVVPGALPAADGSHSLYCAVIVKQVDEKTRARTSVNGLLRHAE